MRLAAQVLASRQGDQVDLLTYHEGTTIAIPNVTLHRIAPPPFASNITPGISLKKLWCDLFFAVTALRMVRGGGYDLVHAVEESVFIALMIKLLCKAPYLYDMDSSLALQVTEKWWLLSPLRPLLAWMEKVAITNSIAVVPVCDALAAIAVKHGNARTTVLSDISLLEEQKGGDPIDLRREAGIAPGELISLYIGNLERYQGIDLMIESLAVLVREGLQTPHRLVVIGGRPEHVAAYTEKAARLGVGNALLFLGPRPVSALNSYLTQADILLSPRTQGNNTPMKVYSYLHSGVPIVATRLSTHTQVLTDEVSMLAAAEPVEFAGAWKNLIQSSELRSRIGSAARALAEARYTFAHFERTLHGIYDRVSEDLGAVRAREPQEA